jgi:hypothetical protein
MWPRPLLVVGALLTTLFLLLLLAQMGDQQADGLLRAVDLSFMPDPARLRVR